MSKLFVYGFALDKYKLFKLKEKYVNLCKKSYLLEKEYSRENEKTTLQLFEGFIL